jgi:ketosteroid isomerase-like protein
MNFLPSLFLALPLVAGGCASQATSASKELMDSDRAFNASTQAHRLEGWVAAFDVNGSQTDEDFRPVTGSVAIRANMQEFFADPLNQLVWEPDRAIVSEHGKLGSVSGRFELSRLRKDGSVESVRRGRYFDVWRRTDDGKWKLLYDIGDFDADEKP